MGFCRGKCALTGFNTETKVELRESCILFLFVITDKVDKPCARMCESNLSIAGFRKNVCFLMTFRVIFLL